MANALLVMGYRAPEILRFALPVYCRAGFDVFLHLDQKADLAAYRAALGEDGAGVRVLAQRVCIYWAGFSMVEAELSLLRAAYRDPAYTQFILVSDDSFPLLPPDRLAAYFDNALDRISARLVGPGEIFHERYRSFFFLDHPATSLYPRPMESARIDDDFLRHVADIARLRAVGKKAIALHYGSQWWGLSRAAVGLVLDRIAADPLLVQSFRYSAAPDEIFLQTVIASFAPAENRPNSPMLVDWARYPRPFLFTALDQIDAMPAAEFAFVRKVAPAPDLLRALQQRLLCP